MGERCHLNRGKFVIYKLLHTRRLSKELSLYDACMFHIIFPRYLLSETVETVEMHCCLYMLQLFFILTFHFSDLDFAFTIITSLLKPHLPQYDPQDAIPRNSSKEAYFLPVRPIPSYQRSTVTWL